MNNNPIGEPLIDKTAHLLTKKVMDLIIERKVSFDQIRELAQYVRTELPLLKTQKDYIDFVDGLEGDFPFLESELKILIAEEKVFEEQAVISKLQQYIKTLN